MNLYLSRICLNPMFAPALRLAADPYQLHRKLLGTLHDHCVQRDNGRKPTIENQPKTAELLFRVDVSDSGPTVLVQTEVEPDWDDFEVAPRALRCSIESKPYAPVLQAGQRLAFRLLCQPSRRPAGQFGLKLNGKRRSGPRRACQNDEERLDWLRRKAQGFGAAIEAVGLTIVEWRNSKPIQGKDGQPLESHEQAAKRAFSPDPQSRLGAVRFDGVLVVRDPEAFRFALQRGVGPGKAFGFGLLSIAPE